MSVVCTGMKFCGRQRSYAQNGQRACYLCVEQRSLSCKNGGTHPWQCAEALDRQRGCNRGCNPSSGKTRRSTRYVLATPRQPRKDVRRRSGQVNEPGILERLWQDTREVRGPKASWSWQSEHVRRNLVADPDGVHAATTIQCRLLQSRWNWQKVKNLVGSRREMMQKQDRCPGGEAFHALPEGHSDACRARFERILGGRRID